MSEKAYFSPPAIPSRADFLLLFDFAQSKSKESMMPRGGYRPGAGRPKTANVQTKIEVRREANKAKMTPLEYMLSVMNDVDAEDGRRDRMAVAAAPFVHAKAEDGKLGKKAERLGRAEQASSAGKFAVRSAPKLVIDNK